MAHTGCRHCGVQAVVAVSLVGHVEGRREPAHRCRAALRFACLGRAGGSGRHGAQSGRRACSRRTSRTRKALKAVTCAAGQDRGTRQELL
jgi:hypothetical protein